MVSQRNMIIGGLFALFSSALFTGKVIVAKLAFAYGIEPVGLLMLRMLFSLPFYIVMLAYQARNGISAPRLEMLKAVGLGLVGYYLSSLFDFYAIDHISTALERMILQLSPSIVMLVGLIFLHEKVDGKLIAAMFVGYVGVVLMVFAEFGGVMTPSRESNLWFGVGCMIGCVFSFAFYAFYAERMMRRMDPAIFTSLAMTGASIGVCVHYAVTHGFTMPVHNTHVYLLGLVMAVFCTVVPSYMISVALHRIGAARMGPFNYAGMGLTFVLSAFVVSEAFPPMKIVGILLASAGALMLTLSRKKQAG